MPFTPLSRLKVALIGSFFFVSGVAAAEANAQGSSPDAALPHLADAQSSVVLPSLSTSSPLGAANSSLSPASPSTLPLQSFSESQYTLGAGDVVRIDIFRVDQYSGESQVLIDGTLNLPLVGRVDVNGLTIDATTEVLSGRYGEFLRRPLITLSLVERRQLQVSIAGEVNRPGPYNIDQDLSQAARLSQLIETAGGITQAAALSQVEVRRPQANGSMKVMAVDLVALIQNGDLNQDVTLRDGDSIFIPTAQTPRENAALIADASFTNADNEPINVAIIGEVYEPGPRTLDSNPGSSSSSPTTVTRAIQEAGGIKPQADIRNIQIVRATRSGTPQIFEVNLWQLVDAGDLQQDAILQAGDTVFVPQTETVLPAEASQLASTTLAPETIQVNVVGEVKRAGTIDLPSNTPLSQAILAAGGFEDTRASRGSVELIRLQDDGTVSRDDITVDFSQGINSEENPLLRNNDVVIVNRNALSSTADTLSTITSPFGGILSILQFLDIFNILD